MRPAGFIYYNFMGFKQQGIAKYLAIFAGPMPILAPLMIPIELISTWRGRFHLPFVFRQHAAGEKVTVVFLD